MDEAWKKAISAGLKGKRGVGKRIEKRGDKLAAKGRASRVAKTAAGYIGGVVIGGGIGGLAAAPVYGLAGRALAKPGLAAGARGMAWATTAATIRNGSAIGGGLFAAKKALKDARKSNKLANSVGKKLQKVGKRLQK
jgi:hypothetical protein